MVARCPRAGALLIRPSGLGAASANTSTVSIFFLLALFIIAGSLEKLPVAARIATRVAAMAGGSPAAAVPLVLATGALGSAFVDNMTFVVFCTPVVQALDQLDPGYHRLWWALLFGSSFGSNVTVFGSAANVIALGMLGTRYRIRVSFLRWLVLGLTTGVLTTAVAWLLL